MPTLYQSVSTTRPFAPGAGAPTATPGPIPAHRLFADSEPREHAPSVRAPPPLQGLPQRHRARSLCSRSLRGIRQPRGHASSVGAPPRCERVGSLLLLLVGPQEVG